MLFGISPRMHFNKKPLYKAFSIENNFKQGKFI